MRRKDYIYTIVALFVTHFFVSVFMALACGVTHPFAFLYEPTKPIWAILSSCLLILPVYAAMGYLYILSKEYLGGMNKVLRRCCLLMFVILALIYLACYLLFYHAHIRSAWMYYVLLNYPSALIFNSISLTADGANWLFLLTVIPAPLGFYLGSMARYRYESVSIIRGK